MAITIGDAILFLKGDRSQLNKDLDKGEQDAEGWVSRLGDKINKKLGEKMAKAGAVLSAALTVPLMALANSSIDAASDLDESMSKVEVVFDDAAGAVKEFADGAAEGLGQSRQQALEAAGTFGNLFVALEVGKGPAAEMSTSLVGLASDLASFNNVDPTQALDALRAGLTGETEPLKRFGVNLNAATIEAKAMELGLVDLAVDMQEVEGRTIALEKAQRDQLKALEKNGSESLEYRDAQQKVAEAESALQAAMAGHAEELTAAQKAQAAYALIMEQTATAQGDFARTSEGLANQTRINEARFADLRAEVGGKLLPIKLKLFEIVGKLLDKFLNMPDGVQKAILIFGGLLMALGPVLTVVGGLITAITTIGPVIAGAGAAIGAVAAGPVLLIIAAIAALIAIGVLVVKNWDAIKAGAIEIWSGITTGIRDKINGARDSIRNTWSSIKSWLTETWSSIKDKASELWTGLVTAIRDRLLSIKDKVKDVWLDLRSWLAETLQRIVEGIRDKWQQAKQWVIDTVLGIVDRVRNLWNDIKEAGARLVDGLKEGIRNAWNGFLDWLRGILNSAIDAVKKFFGISSPSRVFAGIGEQLMAGLSAGIGDGVDVPVRALVDAGQQMLGALGLGGGAARAAGGQYVTVYGGLTLDGVQNRTGLLSELAGMSV